MIAGYEVKPCPRCGAGQEHLHLRTEPPYMVRCGHCGLLGAGSGDSEAAAVAAWNATQAPAAPAASAAEIAGEMLAIVIHDSDLLDVAKDRVEHAKARLAEKLEEPLRKEGAGFFTKELLENFCIGDVADVQAILAAHPSLKPAHDLLDEFFEEADAAGVQEAPKAPNNQQINRTSYYQLPCGLFLEDYIDYREMDFKWGSAVKYEYRAGAKDGEPEGKDRGKRNHYICEIAARDGVAHDAVLLQVRKYVAEAREWNPSPEVRKWYMPYPTDWRPSDEQAA